jgi:hypothetical protein
LEIKNITNEAYKVGLDRLFFAWDSRKQKDRTGLHASSIIDVDSFCFREHILRHHYKPKKSTSWARLLRIFLQGWYIHMKWQYLFEFGGISLAVEKAHFYKFWNFYFTPDAIINMFGKNCVVEIKSHTINGFNELKKPPANAVRQAQIYMHFTGIPYGLILVENKNNQEYKVWLIEYDWTIVKPFVERLVLLKKLFLIYKKEGRLPKKCEKCDFGGLGCSRVRNCNMSHICFGKKEENEAYKREEIFHESIGH